MLCNWGKAGRGLRGAAVLQTQECIHVSEQLFAERSGGSAGWFHGVNPYLDCGFAVPLPTDAVNPTLGARLPAIDVHPPTATQKSHPHTNAKSPDCCYCCCSCRATEAPLASRPSTPLDSGGILRSRRLLR